MAVPDQAFDHPRLAEVYDALEGSRHDLDAYMAMAAEFGARSVVDVGCGTGCLALRLADAGCRVTAVDPASASVRVARSKPGARQVDWVVGDAPSLVVERPGLAAEMAVMTGNVAQVFLTDDEWDRTVRAIHSLLVEGGRFVFETRVPAKRAWEGWNGPGADVTVPGVGRVSDDYRVTETRTDEHGDVFVSFRSDTHFHADGTTLESHSTLRFRELGRIEQSLVRCGFHLGDVRDAPDRPGLEWVVVATRRSLHE